MLNAIPSVPDLSLYKNFITTSNEVRYFLSLFDVQTYANIFTTDSTYIRIQMTAKKKGKTALII